MHAPDPQSAICNPRSSIAAAPSRRRRIEAAVAVGCLAFSGLAFLTVAGLFILNPPPARAACNPATVENCCESNVTSSCEFLAAGATGVCSTAACDMVTFVLLGLHDGTNTVATNVTWTSLDGSFACPPPHETKIRTLVPGTVTWTVFDRTNEICSGGGEVAEVQLPTNVCAATCVFRIASSGTCGAETNEVSGSAKAGNLVTVGHRVPPRFCMLDDGHSTHPFDVFVECDPENWSVRIVPGPDGANANVTEIVHSPTGGTFTLLGSMPGTSAWAVVEARCGSASNIFDVVRLDGLDLINRTCSCNSQVSDGSDDDASPSGEDGILDLMQRTSGGSVTAELHQAYVPCPLYGKDILWRFTNASWTAASGNFRETNRIEVAWNDVGSRRDAVEDWFDCEPDGRRADGSAPELPPEPRRRLETCVAYFGGLIMTATDQDGLKKVATNDTSVAGAFASDFSCRPGSDLLFKPLEVLPADRILELTLLDASSKDKQAELEAVLSGPARVGEANEWSMSVGEDCPDGYFTLKLKDSKHDCVWEEHDVLVAACQSCADGMCQNFGKLEDALGCVDLVFGLGLLPGGGQLPGLRLRADTLDAESFSPTAFLPPHRRYVAGPNGPVGISYVSPDFSTRYAADGQLRQVRILDGLVDIQVVDGTTYVRFFRSAVLANDPVNAPDVMPLPGPGNPVGAQPFVEYRITTVAAIGGIPAVAIVKEYRDGGLVRELRYRKEATGRWVREVRDPNLENFPIMCDTLQHTSLPNGGIRVERTSIAPAGNVLTAAATDWAILSDSSTKVAVRESAGVGAAVLCTTNNYFDAPGTAAHGRLRSSVRPDGSWTLHAYDAEGRVSSETSPFGDAAPVLDASGAVVDWTGDAVRRTYSYAPVDPLDDGSVHPDHARTVTESVGRDAAWTVVRRSFTACYNAAGFAVEVSEQAASSSAAYGDAANLRSVSKRHLGAPHAGRPASRLSPDGSLTRYLYTVGSWDSADPGTFTPVAFGGYLLTETVEGTADLPDGVADRSTRTRTVTDMYGRTRYSSTLLYRGAGQPMPVLSWTLRTLDVDGRVVSETSSDGRLSESQWGCCGPEARTSPEGVAVSYLYDAAKRLVLTSTHNGIADVVTSHAYDAAGRRTSTLVAAGGLVQLSTNVYDSLGRLAWSRGPDGIRTDHEYYANGRITRAIRAGLATESESALDGGAKATRVNGELRSWTVRGVNPDGTRWTTVYEGPLGAASPVWSRTTSDFLGRTLLEERPGFGNTVIATTYEYDASDNLCSSAQICGENTLSRTVYSYDTLGERFRTVQDLDLDGVVDLAGPDRVSDTQSDYVQLGGVWYRETRQYVYPADATPKLVSTQRQRLTGLGTAVPGGILVAESQSLDLLANPTVSRTVLDRAARRVVQTGDGPASTLDALTVSVNGLVLTNVTSTGVTTTHAYDPLGRHISSSTGDRLVALSGYDSLGQLAWSADAANATNRFAYDTFTGRRVAVTNALGQATHTAYDPEGRVVATWGATYPVAYAYDAFGRMTAMATTRDSALDFAPLAAHLASGQSFESFASFGSLDLTRWLYHDPTGLLTNKVYADGKGTAYSYTPDGKVATRTWARLAPGTGLPLQTLYSYDPAGQLAGIAYSDATPAVTFAYDRLGRQTTVTQGDPNDPLAVHTYVYSAATLALAEEHLPDSTVLTRPQDALGRPAGISLSNPDTPTPPYSLTYSYDPLGRFQSVTSAQSADTNTWTYTYLPGSHLLAAVSNNLGLVAARTYEPHRDLIAAVSNTWDSTLVSAFGYENDALGRRTARADSGTAFASTQANAFGYNSRSEVASAAMRNGTSSYTHDPIGNRTEATLPNEPAPITYASNPLNQYTNILLEGEAPSEPSHDADGNMLSGPAGPDRATLAMVWDAENRLIAVTNGNTVVLSDYDYRSRRIRKRVYAFADDAWSLAESRTFLYDGWNLIAEYPHTPTLPNTHTNYYVWGLDLSGSLQGAGGIGGLLSVTAQPGSQQPAAYSPTFDANGNASEYLCLSDGAIAAHYEYDAFGRTIAQSGSLADAFTFRFSTKYLDFETGLYYYGYRWYDPWLGRWISRDPIEEAGGENLYGFVGNDGVGLVDPTGLRCKISIAFGHAFDLDEEAVQDLEKQGHTRQEIISNWQLLGKAATPKYAYLKLLEVSRRGDECDRLSAITCYASGIRSYLLEMLKGAGGVPELDPNLRGMRNIGVSTPLAFESMIATFHNFRSFIRSAVPDLCSGKCCCSTVMITVYIDPDRVREWQTVVQKEGAGIAFLDPKTIEYGLERYDPTKQVKSISIRYNCEAKYFEFLGELSEEAINEWVR